MESLPAGVADQLPTSISPTGNNGTVCHVFSFLAISSRHTKQLLPGKKAHLVNRAFYQKAR